MKRMWIRISKRLAVESALISIGSFAVCSLYAMAKGYSFKCNWTDEYSNAWLVMMKCTDININTFYMQIICLVFVFSEIYVSGLLIMLITSFICSCIWV